MGGTPGLGGAPASAAAVTSAVPAAMHAAPAPQRADSAWPKKSHAKAPCSTMAAELRRAEATSGGPELCGRDREGRVSS